MEKKKQFPDIVILSLFTMNLLTPQRRLAVAVAVGLVIDLAGAEHVSSLSGYVYHYCAVFAPSGNLKCWGEATNGKVCCVSL